VNAERGPTVLHCPLCNGPLHTEESGLVCTIGHRVEIEDAIRHTNARLAEAMWMAIEALDSEAMTLRLLSTEPDAERMADDAEQQAQLLRAFSRRHHAHDAGRPSEA
jgi:hypothetical protein